jgi:hypothetical protein
MVDGPRRFGLLGSRKRGGGWSPKLKKRLDIWTSRAQKELEDAPTFYPAAGNYAWHGESATSQATWKKLICMLLLARGERDDDKSILNYQRTQLGSVSGDTCLADLLPLPSPDTATWNYNRWSDSPELSSRHAYLAHVLNPRVDALKRRCASCRPLVVIFYGLQLADGTKLLPLWSRIAGGWFDQAFEGRKILLCRRNLHTDFFVTRHPVSEGDAYFREIGCFLRDHHSTQLLRWK